MIGATATGLRIALLGTRGVPARYGGFETAVEEIGSRLADHGHDVTVYCRHENPERPNERFHRGMELVILPALRLRSLETLTHSALAVLHAVTRRRFDAVFVFNAANAVLLPALRARAVPTAVHVDGLEWQRAKWGGAGRRYYRLAESLAVRWSDALIADAPGIADYYSRVFGASTELLTYGAPILSDLPHDRLDDLGVAAGQYHLVVARWEPENHVDLIVRGFRASAARLPLVVVGGAPYSRAYTRTVREAAGDDERVRLVGSVWDEQALNQLYAHARLYLHGHSVGGTNPSLLRAMGAGTAVCAYDVEFNRWVLGSGSSTFAHPADVAAAVEAAESDPDANAEAGSSLRATARSRFMWDDVARGYEDLAHRLHDGHSRRGESSGRRRAPR